MLSLSDDTGVVCNSLQFFLSLSLSGMYVGAFMYLYIVHLYISVVFCGWAEPALQFWDILEQIVRSQCAEVTCDMEGVANVMDWCEIFFFFFYPFQY